VMAVADENIFIRIILFGHGVIPLKSFFVLIGFLAL